MPEGRSFRRGASEGKKAANKPSSPSRRPVFFKLADGEQAFVQLVTDYWEWVDVDMHLQVPTKPQPSDWDGNWPAYVSAVCRRTKMGDGLPLYDDCYVCESMRTKEGKPIRRSPRTWALGIYRQEVVGDGTPDKGGPDKRGRRIGFTEMKVEVPILDAEGNPTDRTELIPQAVVFSMGWKNFFSFIEATATAMGSVTNLVFAIRREGEGLDTVYPSTHVQTLKTKDFNNPTYAATLGIKVDLDKTIDEEGHPYKEYPPHLDLVKMVEHRASDEYYARYIDPRMEAPVSARASSSSAPVVPKPSNDMEDPDFNSLRDRLRTYANLESQPADTATADTSPSDEEFDVDESGEAMEVE